MLAICAADTPVVFKAPKPSSNAERCFPKAFKSWSLNQDTEAFKLSLKQSLCQQRARHSCSKTRDSPEDDRVIVVDDTDEDGEDEIHVATNDETEDTLVPKSSS
ncbi:hypothetical protein Tco_1144023 [Tanacetum coccineum]